MIHAVYPSDHTFIRIVAKQKWLDEDIYEAKELTGKSIYSLLRNGIDSKSVQCLIMNGDVVLSAAILGNDNTLTYFNTTNVKDCLRAYLLFLRQFVQGYLLERSYLIVWSLSKYVTTTKKLKFLGFRRLRVDFRRTQWVAQVKQ